MVPTSSVNNKKGNQAASSLLTLDARAPRKAWVTVDAVKKTLVTCSMHLGRASALFGGEKTRSGRNASPFRLATSATEREEPELHHPSYNFTNLPTAAKTHVHTPSFILLPLHCRGILDTLLFAHRTIGFKAPGSRPAPSSLGL